MVREDPHWINEKAHAAEMKKRKEEKKKEKEAWEAKKAELQRPPGCMTKLKRKIAGKAAKVAGLTGN